MSYARIVGLPVLALTIAAGVPIFGQTVVSTHAGVIYFFEGSVFNGDVRLEQKFGKFPDIPEGGEFRTEDGRAEVLLTPGVVLRMDTHTSIRLLSSKLSDAQVELLAGSAIFESGRSEPDTSAQLIYKSWHIRTRGAGAYRIETEPPRVRVYKGQAEVTADGRPETVAMDGEVLPLADVLVPEQSTESNADPFQNWAMSRSQAIAADNSIAADIIDDPSRVDVTGLDLGGFTYFPLTGYPSLGIGNPYGLSFWSPYQSNLWSTYPSWYRLGLGRPSWSLAAPSYSRPAYGTRPWRPGPGLSPGGATSHRFGVEPRPIGPRPGAPHGGFHGGGRR